MPAPWLELRLPVGQKFGKKFHFSVYHVRQRSHDARILCPENQLTNFHLSHKIYFCVMRILKIFRAVTHNGDKSKAPSERGKRWWGWGEIISLLFKSDVTFD